MTLEGYKKHLVHKAAPGPLSESEIEAKMVQEMETRSDIGVDTKSQTLPGLAFPMEEAALAKVKDLRDFKNTYVQLVRKSRKKIHIFQDFSVCFLCVLICLFLIFLSINALRDLNVICAL